MDIATLLRAIGSRAGCRVFPVSGPVRVEPHHTVPRDVADFYAACGGAELFADQFFGALILPPEQVVKANLAIVGEEFPDDPSDAWYLIAKTNDSASSAISADFGDVHNGRCYDSYWDRHGVAGSMDVVASSFTDLLEWMLRAEGRALHWTDPSFPALGDAYD
ncbi:SMI1/KNR4 family protein [Dactylosporangium sp. NPDC049742]|uniref:SMI1/KNR4 family protein n=1 Tax=Dactylosporangium sp. NPDC049742 TaxID=3154737 RepID=UPI0034151F4A